MQKNIFLVNCIFLALPGIYIHMGLFPETQAGIRRLNNKGIIMLGVSLILISIATAVALIFNYFFAYLRNKNNVALLKQHLEAGHPLNADIISLVKGQTRGGFPDVRKAILLISLGIAGLIFSQFVGGGENARLALGLSIFPLILGIGFLFSMAIEKWTSRSEGS